MRPFNQLDSAQPVTAEETLPEYTGRYLVVFQEDAVEAGTAALRDAGEVQVSSTADFEQGILPEEAIQSADAVVFHNLGVALMDAAPQATEAVTSAAVTDPSIVAIEPERVCYTLDGGGSESIDYLRGYRDGVREALGGQAFPREQAGLISEAAVFDESGFTWGLQATRVDCTSGSGTGIKVAVLDTGIYLAHPDFQGRNIQTQSFITGETVDDVIGHGTHCVGTACGSKTPGTPPRYGVARDADIFMGKVLNNQGRGGDGGILAGINWAVGNGCRVVSMSLGARVSVGTPFSVVFEQAAGRALAAGTLIVAAAGNDSYRPYRVSPVSHPANCPSIVAVAAVDSRSQVAYFSNGGLSPQGGEVNIAGPGVDVRSAWPAPILYRTISGTSMATPHVAGIAALYSQVSGIGGAALRQELVSNARNIGLSAQDAGAGLVQAPR